MKEIACVEKNAIVHLKLLHDSLTKVKSSWNGQFLNNVIILGRKLMTSDKSHAAFQVLTICEDENTKLHNAILSNPEEMTVENIKKNAETMKDSYFKKIDHKGIRFKHEILSCICLIDFF